MSEPDPNDPNCKVLMTSVYSPGEWEEVYVCDIVECSKQSVHITKVVMKDGRVILCNEDCEYIYATKRNCGCPGE